MKYWQALLLVGLLASVPLFSACDLLGIGGSKDDYYKQQMELMQKQQQLNQQAQEQYNEQLQKSLQDYLNQYQAYSQQQQQQQLQAAEQALQNQQTTQVPYN